MHPAYWILANGASEKKRSNPAFRLCSGTADSGHVGGYGSVVIHVADERGPLGPSGTGFDAASRSVHFSPPAWSRWSETWWYSARLASSHSCQTGGGASVGVAGCGWTRLAYPLWRRRVMRSRRKSCAVSTNVLDSRVTKATVAQGIKQREDSGFKLCSSHNCAGLRPKVKAGSGPKWLPSAPQEWVQRRSHNSLNNFLHCKWNRKHFSSFCCGSRLKTVWDASGIVGLSLLKGHFDTRGHRQLGAEFMQFSG